MTGSLLKLPWVSDAGASSGVRAILHHPKIVKFQVSQFLDVFTFLDTLFVIMKFLVYGFYFLFLGGKILQF